MNDILFTDVIDYSFMYDKNCYFISGKVIDTLLIFDNIEYKDTINTIYYQEKIKRNFLQWLTFRQKIYRNYVKTKSKCGETKTEMFEFVE